MIGEMILPKMMFLKFSILENLTTSNMAYTFVVALTVVISAESLAPTVFPRA